MWLNSTGKLPWYFSSFQPHKIAGFSMAVMQYIIFIPKHLRFCFSFQHSKGIIKKLPMFVSALDAIRRYAWFSFPEYLENPTVTVNNWGRGCTLERVWKEQEFSWHQKWKYQCWETPGRQRLFPSVVWNSCSEDGVLEVPPLWETCGLILDFHSSIA